MDYKAIGLGMGSTIKTLFSGLPIKLSGSVILALLLHQYAVLFYAFTFLVFLDCFTRWMSISYERLVGRGEQTHLLNVLKGIKAARSEGLISSNVMKHRFVGKIVVYIICVVAAGVVDVCMLELIKPVWAVATVISYLVITELLSIVENLNDAGIEALQGLLDIIRKKG